MTTERPDQLRWPTPAGAVTPKAGHRITKSRNEGRAGHAFDDNTHPRRSFQFAGIQNFV